MTATLLYLLPAFIVTGLLAGFTAGLFGVGGGVIVVPALYALFTLSGVDATTAITVAVGSSLVTLMFTSFSSVRSHHQLGHVDWSALTFIAPAIIVGSLLGSLFVIEQLGKVLLTVFSVMLLLVACLLIMQYGLNKKVTTPTQNTLLHTPLGRIGVATVLGLTSSLSGVGGGALGVPWLMFLGLRIHRAVGTAAVFGLLVSIPAVISVLLFANTISGAPLGTWKVICIPAVIVLCLCSVFTAPLGARVGKRFSERTLKLLFCAFLVAVGLRLVASAMVI